MQLTEHFALDDFTLSETAIRHNLSNIPNAEQIGNLTILARNLEIVRTLLGHPLHITSGFRSPAVNEEVGGSLGSAHMQGYAADFTCRDFGTPLQVCHAIADSDLEFDQCIFELGAWVHFSVDPRMRRLLTTATLLAGKVQYTSGIA